MATTIATITAAVAIAVVATAVTVLAAVAVATAALVCGAFRWRGEMQQLGRRGEAAHVQAARAARDSISCAGARVARR